MLNVLILDDTLRLGFKLAKVIEYNFKFKTKTFDFKQFHPTKLITYKTDVLFVDISEHQLKAVEIISEIRNNQKLKHISIIIVTSVIQKDVLIDIIKYGIIEIIVKPYDYNKLPDLLNIIFEKIALHKNLTLQDFQEKDNISIFSSINKLDNFLSVIKRHYIYLIKDILRQEYRTKVKKNINFNTWEENKINEAVVYTAIYKDSLNFKYILTFISTYNDILDIFTINYNKKTKLIDCDILQRCDEFSQAVFNRLLLLLSNVIKGLVKIETNLAFYNFYEITE
nr:response regulator [Melioribacteraceae bacterium]